MATVLASVQPAAAAEPVRSFAIPASPLGRALKLYAKAANRQIIFSNAAVAPFQAPPLQGLFTPDEALARLIDGTGLVSRLTSSGVLIVDAAPARVIRASAQQTIAPASAHAQSPAVVATSAADNATLGEIIVTARRVDERLQDVPISITVFSQEQIADRNIMSAGDLATYTPSLWANVRAGANSASYAIRGFTQEMRTSASVAVYFADVVAPRGGNSGVSAGDGAGPGAFFDLQNVQVLKGPQGTLFGRNTTGGAVLLVPQKPTRRFEGYVEGSYGDYDMKRLQAVVNLPFGEAARMRLGIDRNSRDGYIKNISGTGPSRLGDLDYTSLRGSLVLDIAPDVENYTIASYTKSEDNGATAKLTACTNAFPNGLLACQQIARQAGAGFYTVQNRLADPVSRLEQWQLINTTTWRVNDALTIKNIASYSELRTFLRTDYIGTRFVIPTTFGPIANTGALAGTVLGIGFPNPAPGLNTADQNNFTEELQFIGKAYDGRLDWQAGGYYEESNPSAPSGVAGYPFLSCTDPATFQCRDVMAQLLGRPTVGSINYSVGEVAFQNVALYAQATYKLRANLKLTGGFRYTWDRTTATARQVNYRFFQPNVPTGTCTFPSPAAPGNIPVSSPEQCLTWAKQKSDAPTWVLGLDYNPSDNVMIYGKYSRGYRQGAVNFAAPVQFQAFGPEKVDTYEVGVKSSFHGPVPGSFNAAAFYNDFTGQQLAVGVQSSTNAAPNSQAVLNAGKSRIYGVEIDATLSPTRLLKLDGSYTYLNTKLISRDPVTVAPGSPYDIFSFAALPGTRLAFTPEHKASVTATYQLPISGEMGDVRVSATYAYSSNYISTTGPFGKIPSLGLLNLNLNWNDVGRKPIDLSLFMTNVTNEKYYINVSDFRASAGLVSQVMGQPRMYGARLRYRFGD